MKYLIGQQVVLNGDEIGTVVISETGTTHGVWVHSPSKKYASDYAMHNVKPYYGEAQAEIDALVSHSEGLVTLISTLWDKYPPAYNHELSIEISDTIDKHEALIAKHKGE